jgi:hypothetical protein
MVDKSISFGQQNFFFVDSSEADGTYDYVSYQSHKGSILIARFNKAGTEGRYYLGSGVYATIWAARTAKTYGLPNTLVDQNLV